MGGFYHKRKTRGNTRSRTLIPNRCYPYTKEGLIFSTSNYAIVGDLVTEFLAFSDDEKIETFGETVIISFTYSDEQIRELGISEGFLTIHRWKADDKTWKPLKSEIDLTTRTVSAHTDNFSIFVLIGRLEDGSIAGTTNEELRVKVTKVMERISQLRARIQELLEEKPLHEPSICVLVADIDYGDSGDDVRCLQTFLKSEGSGIYPEGIVSG